LTVPNYKGNLFTFCEAKGHIRLSLAKPVATISIDFTKIKIAIPYIVCTIRFSILLGLNENPVI